MEVNMRIINLTQHPVSVEQKEAGVFEPADKEFVKALLTFEKIPQREQIISNALGLANQASMVEADAALIGGFLPLMHPLEDALRSKGIIPLYAFTKRVVEEKEGIKTSCFVHEGFVEAV